MASGGSKQKPNKGLSREEKESKKVFEEAHIMIDKMRMDMGEGCNRRIFPQYCRGHDKETQYLLRQCL